MSLFSKNDPTLISAGQLEQILAKLNLFPAAPFYFSEATRPAGSNPFWYSAGGPMITNGSGAVSVGNLLVYPFFSGTGGLIDRIKMNVTVGGTAGSQLRFGIWNDNGHYPGTLLFDSGDFDSTVVSEKIATISPPLRLESNSIYWFGYICGTAAPTLTVSNPGSNYIYTGFMGTLDGAGAVPAMGWLNTRAYGALPTQFPSGQPQFGNSNSAFSLAYIAVRFASLLP